MGSDCVGFIEDRLRTSNVSVRFACSDAVENALIVSTIDNGHLGAIYGKRLANPPAVSDPLLATPYRKKSFRYRIIPPLLAISPEQSSQNGRSVVFGTTGLVSQAKTARGMLQDAIFFLRESLK